MSEILEKMNAYKQKLQNTIEILTQYDIVFNRLRTEEPEIIIKIYDNIWNITDSKEREINAMLPIIDENIDKLNEIKPLFDDFQNKINNIRKIINELKMSESLEDKMRKIIKKYDITTDNINTQTILDRSF